MNSNYCQNKTNKNDHDSDCSEEPLNTHSVTRINNNTDKRKSKKHEGTKSILDFVKRKSKFEDEDYCFAKSLISEIKKVSQQSKLKLKSELYLLISHHQQLPAVPNLPQLYNQNYESIYNHTHSDPSTSHCYPLQAQLNDPFYIGNF